MGTVSTPQTGSMRSRGRRFGRAALVATTSMSLAVVALPTVATTSAQADTAPKRMMSGWLPYWTNQASVDSFLANSDLFSDISPFWHNAVSSGSTASGIAIQNNALSSGTRAGTLAQLKGHGALVLPTITDGSGAGRMSAVLRNATKRAALVSQIAALVNTSGYDGIDLDFETFAFSDGQSSWNATRPAWVAFIASLADTLHASGKKLSVAVPPEGTSDSNYWVYDWKDIGPYIDKLRVMAYDYSWDSPGPVGGPLSWLQQIAAHAVSVMPGSKVELGTPTYGRDWVKSKSGSGCPSVSQKVYDSNQIGSVLGVPDSSWKRDASSQERYFNYKVTYNNGACTVQRSAWVPDTTTVLARAQIASQYGLSGLATWTIGGEQASLWAPLRNLALTLPFATNAGGGRAAQRINVHLSAKVIRRNGKVTLTGKVKPGRAGVKVKLQKKHNGKWYTKKIIRTVGTGTYIGSLKISAKTQLRAVVPASGQYVKAVTPARTIKVKK